MIPEIQQAFDADAENIAKIYGRSVDDPMAVPDFYGDIVFGAPTHNLVVYMRHVSAEAYRYYMDYVKEEFIGLVPGTRHGGEVGLVFDNLRTFELDERQ
jgi:carboxylesterase type B